MFFFSGLCFSDEGRSAVDLAGGAQIVAELIKSLFQNTEPENEKLLTVLCGLLMNYSNDNGNYHLPRNNLKSCRQPAEVLVSSPHADNGGSSRASSAFG